MIDLNNIPEGQLLSTRLCDLPITLEGTWVQACVDQLHQELKAKGLCFFPRCYLADEWLTPEGETVIGIPFYLAHPVLMKLENKMMLEAEGDDKEWCMQLLRHEAGHAICYAYRLNERPDWQKTFGSPAVEYGQTYKYKPYSKSFVRHLDGFYAQYHPDEDFVETFAVWLTPGSDWQQQYRMTPALQKLEYVDGLMSQIKGQKPRVRSGRKLWAQAKSRLTLAKYYAKKQQGREDLPDFYDEGLMKIFKPLSQEEWLAFRKEKKKLAQDALAYKLMAAHSKTLVHSINRCTGERKYIIHELLRNIGLRTRQLNMVIDGPHAETLVRLSVYLTSLVANYVHTGWYRGKVKRT